MSDDTDTGWRPSSSDLQAIRKHLRVTAEEAAEDDWKRDAFDMLADWGLPGSVIDWVLEAST